jgi:hypothetical protein
MKIPTALKHGAYSGMTVLPGEDPAGFRKLREDLFAEFAPDGALEDDTVENIARLTWRKQNLLTYGMAAKARSLRAGVESKYDFRPPFPTLLDRGHTDPRTPEQIKADRLAAEQEAKRLLGEPVFELCELGDVVTFDRLFQDLSVIDRLDGMVERCIKRLLMVRGVKSLAQSESPASSTLPRALPPPKQSTAKTRRTRKVD